jgi:undecaprenyl-diphosphatase
MASLDGDAHRWFLEQRTAALDHFFRTVTDFGAAAVLLPLAIVLVVVLAWRRRPDLALGATTAMIGSWLTVNLLLKPLVGRARPPFADQLVHPGGASFPSGHAANAAAVWFTVAWAVASLTTSRAVKVTVWAGAIVIAALVGVSRLYLGVHWPSDVVAGWAIGGLWVAAGAWVAAQVRRRRAGERSEPVSR